MKRILIATRNPAKEAFYCSLFTETGVAAVRMDAVRMDAVRINAVHITGKPEENGATAEENAEIKARFYACAAGMPAFSDDAALYADFLPADRQPGPHVRRVNGRDEASDEEMRAFWYPLVAAAPPAQRAGRWQVGLCCASPNGWSWTGSLAFPIAFFWPPSPIVMPHWPMNSICGPLEWMKPYSELTSEEYRQSLEGQSRLIAGLVADFVAQMPD